MKGLKRFLKLVIIAFLFVGVIALPIGLYLAIDRHLSLDAQLIAAEFYDLNLSLPTPHYEERVLRPVMWGVSWSPEGDKLGYCLDDEPLSSLTLPAPSVAGPRACTGPDDPAGGLPIGALLVSSGLLPPHAIPIKLSPTRAPKASA